MAKISLNNVASGYNRSKINQNFVDLQEELQDKVLYRDNPTGEPNHMENNLDMNGNSIVNVNTDFGMGNSVVTAADADARYIQVAGDAMTGDLDASAGKLTIRAPVEGTEPAQKQQLDSETSLRISNDDSIRTNYQAADAHLQGQISGGDPLQASAFSEISWHDQVVTNSVTIPDNKNAWSFGPTMTVDASATVTIGTGSFWTIAEGSLV